LGTACCILSAVCYTAANICMRRLTVLEADAIWVMCCKEAVAPLLVGPVLAVMALCGRRVLPPLRVLGLLALVGLAVEILGNVGMQWALGIIGLAVEIPIDFGVMLVASALLGGLVLGERLTARTLAALALLLGSIAVLACSAGPASRAVAAAALRTPDAATVVLAIAAVCLAGAVFAVLAIAIRWSLTGGASLGIVVLMIPLMGPLSLGPLSVCRLGLRPLWTTPPEQYAWMLAGGVLNVVAFLAVCKGLHLITVVRVNMLNASQVAMAALAGVVLFRESPTGWLMLGVGLTLLGILLMDRPEAQACTNEDL
jgi:drug/metabolite transporter (DMT)-like permease